MATKLHNQMTGADLHPNAIDGTTGTELTPASQTTYDGRYVRTIGGTVTPTSNSTTTLKVTKADGTTNVLVVDTTNQRIGVNIVSPAVALSLGVAIANTKLAIYDGGATLYGFGIGSSQFRIHVGSSGDRFAFLNAPAGTEVFTVLGTGNVGIGATGPHTALQIVGPIATAISTTAKTTAYTATATDSTILADASGGTFQITLPTAVGCAGRQYTIKRIGATNNVTVGGTSAQTIDGVATKTLGAQYSTLTVQSDNANWQIIGQLGTVS